MMHDTPRRRADDRYAAGGSDLSGRIGEDSHAMVLDAVRRANDAGTPITTWDLPRITGLPLHAASVAVRKLEFGRLLVIDDNPSDPFGATLKALQQIVPSAQTRVDTRRVA